VSLASGDNPQTAIGLRVNACGRGKEPASRRQARRDRTGPVRGTPCRSSPTRRVVEQRGRCEVSAFCRVKRRACRCLTAARALPVPAPTNTIVIGAASRVAPRNSREFDDRFPGLRSVADSAAAATWTFISRQSRLRQRTGPIPPKCGQESRLHPASRRSPRTQRPSRPRRTSGLSRKRPQPRSRRSQSRHPTTRCPASG
jgi:hypothetical protein